MICYLSSLGGSNLRDSVRRMMKRLGTKRLWSPYSFIGRKGKKAFQDILLCRVLISVYADERDNIWSGGGD
ncbi:hypothetical protein ACJMK2_025624 [Sinanodonta woodiana]|uniref:Uncharacterized protein n=2 Tax=Sinanodonta woodiana TaxID=1069815 RepID=A0ABD3XJG5_SINWO